MPRFRGEHYFQFTFGQRLLAMLQPEFAHRRRHFILLQACRSGRITLFAQETDLPNQAADTSQACAIDRELRGRKIIQLELVLPTTPLNLGSIKLRLIPDSSSSWYRAGGPRLSDW